MFINKNFIKSIKTAAGTAAKAGCSGGVREVRGSKASKGELRRIRANFVWKVQRENFSRKL